MNVTRAVIGTCPALATTMSPAVPSAPVAGTPGQNHVLVTALAVGTAGIHGSGTAANVDGVGVSVSWATTPMPTAATTATASMGRRRTIIAAPPAWPPARPGRARPG